MRPLRPAPLLPAILLVSLLFSLAVCSFLPANLRGLYIIRIGSNICPQLIQISTTTLSLPPSSISLNNRTCTSGSLSLSLSPSTPSTALFSSQLLSRFLLGTPQAGDFILATVTSNLTCPDRFFRPDTGFVFLSANSTFSVSWARVFENANTQLARLSPTGDAFTFEKDAQHMIINDACLYNRIDIPPGSTRACFPANAQVRLRDGRTIRMDEVQRGDWVLASERGEYSRVTLFTHRAKRYMWVVELQIANHTLQASPGHLVHVHGIGVSRMRDVRVGMKMRLEGGDWGRVERVTVRLAWGMYNAQTESGEVVVDGVVCTCYTDAVGGGAGHALMVPVRAVGGWVRAMRGVAMGGSRVEGVADGGG